MRWPWQRAVDDGGRPVWGGSPGARAGASAGGADTPPSPAGWAFLPALQRTVGAQDLVTRPAAFVSSLPAWSSPAFMGGMGRTMSPDAPGGMLDGDGSGLPQLTAVATDMPLAPDDAHRTGVQRTAASAAAVQRSAAPDGASSRAAIAPTLTSPGTEGFGVFNVPAVEPDQLVQPDPGIDQGHVDGAGLSEAPDAGIEQGQDPLPAVPVSRMTETDPVSPDAGAGIADVTGAVEQRATTAGQLPLPGRPAGAVRSAYAVTIPLGPPAPDPSAGAAVATPAQSSAILQRDAAPQSLGSIQRTSEEPFVAGIAVPTPGLGLSGIPGPAAGRRLGFGAPIQRWPAESGPPEARSADPGAPETASSGSSPAATGNDASATEVLPLPPSAPEPAAVREPAAEDGSSGPVTEAAVTEDAIGTESMDLPVARVISLAGSLARRDGNVAAVQESSPAGIGTGGRPDPPSGPGNIDGLPLAATATSQATAATQRTDGTTATTDSGLTGSGLPEAAPAPEESEASLPGPANHAVAGVPPLQLPDTTEGNEPGDTLPDEDVALAPPAPAAAPSGLDVAMPLLGATPRGTARSGADWLGTAPPESAAGEPSALSGRSGSYPGVVLPLSRSVDAPSVPDKVSGRSGDPGTGTPAAVVLRSAVEGWPGTAAAGPAAGGTQTAVLSREAVLPPSEAFQRTVGPTRPDSLFQAPAREPLPLPTAPKVSGPGRATGTAMVPATQSPTTLLRATPPASLQRATDGDADTPSEAPPPPATAEAPATADAPVSWSSEAPRGSDGATDNGPQALPAAQSGQQIEELVDKLYTPLVRRLKAELLLDRERRGLRTDLR